MHSTSPYRYLWFICAGLLHGALIGGAVITLYPTKYTAQAQFLIQEPHSQSKKSNVQAQFFNALSRANTRPIHSSIIQTLALNSHPIINQRLPADNTKWSSAMVSVRKIIKPQIFSTPLQPYLYARLSSITSLTQNKTNKSVRVNVTTKSPYMSQDIANALGRGYQAQLKDAYDFTTYDTYTNTLPAASQMKSSIPNIVFIPAGHSAAPTPKPFLLIILFCALGGVIFGAVFATLRRGL